MTAAITPEEVVQQLEQGDRLTIVDVREREEWVEGHIKQAVHIPLSELEARVKEFDQLEQPVIMVCRSGGRSGRACDFLEAHGYSVINMTGGMLQWPSVVEAGE